MKHSTKEKCYNSTNIHVKHTSVFLDPSKSNILWHDLKRDFVIMRGFAENLESGVYGILPKDAIDPIHSMQDVSVRSLLMIENLMVLNKHEQNLFTIKKESVQTKDITKEITSFLKKDFPQKNAPKTLHVDRRYGRLLFENLLYVGHQLETAPSFKWSDVTFSLSLVSTLPMTLEKPQTLLFQENAPLSNELILSLAVAQLLAHYHDFSFDLIQKKQGTILQLTYVEKK